MDPETTARRKKRRNRRRPRNPQNQHRKEDSTRAIATGNTEHDAPPPQPPMRTGRPTMFQTDDASNTENPEGHEPSGKVIMPTKPPTDTERNHPDAQRNRAGATPKMPRGTTQRDREARKPCITYGQ